MDISKHLEKAEEAVRRRNYALAIDLYQRLLDLAPDDATARRGLRGALARKFEGKKVSRPVAFLSGLVPRLAARLSRMLRSHKAAARAYERYLAHDPFNSGVNRSLALSLEKSASPRSAVEVWRFMAERDAQDVDAAKRAGALLYQLKDLNGSLQMYERALAADPRDAEALRARKNLAAEGALQTSGLAGARSSRELVKDKDLQKELERSQRLHRTDDELADELQRVEAGLATAPADAKALARKSELLEMRGDHAGALACIEQALRADPGSYDLLARGGDLRIAQARSAVEAARKDGDAARVTAAERKLLEVEVAEHQARVKARPTDPALHQQLGATLRRSGRLDEAIAEFQQAVRDPRQRLDALLALGDCFHEKGHLDLARSQLEKAIEGLGPTLPRTKDVLYQLGVIAEKQGRKVDAAGFFARVYEVDISYKDVARKVEQLKA